jgi:hypothetical protein
VQLLGDCTDSDDVSKPHDVRGETQPMPPPGRPTDLLIGSISRLSRGHNHQSLLGDSDPASSARSVALQACSRMASPPLSWMSYSDMTDRQSLAPAVPRVAGGSLPVDADPTCSGWFLRFSCHGFLARIFC